MGSNVGVGWEEGRVQRFHLNPGIHRQKMGDVWEELKTEKLQSPEVGEIGTQEEGGKWLVALVHDNPLPTRFR